MIDVNVTEETRILVGAYHRAWTANDHDAFHSYLHPDVTFDFPIEIRWPEGTVVDLLDEVVDGLEAVQIYEARSPGGRRVRVAEHLTVRDGKVWRIAPVFDEASMRAFMAS